MDKIQQIQEALSNAGISFEINEHRQTLDVTVTGDWKHSHQHCDEIMRNLGYEKVMEIKSQADPNIIYDDWYTSYHYYLPPE